ncbi:hypothetical protein QYE76_032193 [Lolium multiflorum]|uniref:Retrotransposon gag domain-containing protein n=1 Tax=Lolium multiflorum TaxID=4521 RepID=A0AAD8QT11_LOLMU|nr:hypothetical protein QYE76_032193 [Lolium multiflorum]
MSSPAAASSLSSSISSAPSADDLAKLRPAPPATTAVGSHSSGPVHFGHLISVKLAADTHLLWRAQFVSLLRSNLLHPYVEGTFSCPPSTVSIPREGGAPESNARASQIRAQLAKTAKLDKSMAVFYNSIKTLADTLASIGQPLRPEEFNDFVLDGLHEDYYSIVELVRDRTDPMPAHDLYARLLAMEQRIETRWSSPHQDNAARYGSKAPRPPMPGASPSTPRPGTPTLKRYYAPRPAGGVPPVSGAGGGQPEKCSGGRPNGRASGHNDGQRPASICQLCDKSGHVASRCFKRFQKDFLGMYNYGRFLDCQLSMANYVHGPEGHTSTLPADPTWYMNTGATDHFPAEMEKLHMREPYHGKEHLHMADGSGTTLSTSAALDSPSVIDKLVSPPHASRAGTSAESENSHNIDNVSAVLDDSGSLGSFLDATIAKSRQIENTETPNAATPVNSPESVEYSSDDLDEDYVELDDDFIEKCNATTDARKIKKLLAEHAVRYKLSPDPKFATSPINIRDKDYDFSLDLSHIAIVEKTPFCGTEKESAVEHMTELSTLSGLFSDDIKMRTYFVAKIFPFSLKDDAKTWYNNLPPGSIKSPKELLDVFFRKYFPASAQHAALQRIYNFDQEDGEKLPEAWARFCSLIRAQPDHDLEKHDLLDIFYSGLTIESRAYLDSCAGCVFRKRTPEDAEELLAKIGRNHDDWSTPEPTPTPIVKKRGMIKLNDEDMREAKKSLKEKGIKPEDVKNLPPIEDICETIPPSSMIEYMKDIVTNKRKIPNEEISTMLANYSFNGKIPKKLGDPDKLIPTDISLQMADKSTAIPVGLCENVPVQVTQHCLILTDFVVLEMPEDDNMSIILGRPFLNTAGAVIDCNKGMVTFNVDDKEHTVYFPKRIDKDFKFNWSRSDPMVQYKIYNKAVNLPFSVFCAAIGVPQWGSCEKIRGTPRELSDLYTRICNGRSLSNDDAACAWVLAGWTWSTAGSPRRVLTRLEWPHACLSYACRGGARALSRRLNGIFCTGCRGYSSAMPSDRGLGLMESCRLTRDIGSQTSGESDLPRVRLRSRREAKCCGDLALDFWWLRLLRLIVSLGSPSPGLYIGGQVSRDLTEYD